MDKLRGGTTIGGNLALHYGNIGSIDIVSETGKNIQSTILCATTCSITPIACGITCVKSPVVCATTCSITPIACGITCVKGQLVCSAGTILASSCVYSATAMCSPYACFTASNAIRTCTDCIIAAACINSATCVKSVNNCTTGTLNVGYCDSGADHFGIINLRSTYAAGNKLGTICQNCNNHTTFGSHICVASVYSRGLLCANGVVCGDGIQSSSYVTGVCIYGSTCICGACVRGTNSCMSGNACAQTVCGMTAVNTPIVNSTLIQAGGGAIDTGISFEAGKHHIVSNDGGGNFNIRVGNHFTSGITEDGYASHWINNQIDGVWDFKSTTASQLTGTAPTWQTSLSLTPTGALNALLCTKAPVVCGSTAICSPNICATTSMYVAGKNLVTSMNHCVCCYTAANVNAYPIVWRSGCSLYSSACIKIVPDGRLCVPILCACTAVCTAGNVNSGGYLMSKGANKIGLYTGNSAGGNDYYSIHEFRGTDATGVAKCGRLCFRGTTCTMYSSTYTCAPRAFGCIICANSCLCSPVVCAPTAVRAKYLCAANNICAIGTICGDNICGRATLSAPTTYGTTTVCAGQIICSNNVIGAAGTICGTGSVCSASCVYATGCSSASIACGRTCVKSAIVCGTSCVKSPTVYGTSTICSGGTVKIGTVVGLHMSHVIPDVMLDHEEDGLFVFRGVGKATMMTIQTTSGDVVASGNVTAYSDCRVKKNICKIECPIFKINQLNGYTFDRVDIDGPTQTGVIAQELKEVLPEAVIGGPTESDPDGKYSVAYGNIVGLLIEGIKEQQSDINCLKQIIQGLK